MLFGLDYVSGPPIAAMKAANITFVCRYFCFLNDLTREKILYAPEAKALMAAGISPVSNYEWYKTRATEGIDAGKEDARIAAAQHQAAGGPPTRPIYFSVDEDVSGEQVAPYFIGIAQIIGKQRTGAYGSYRVLKYLFDHGLITWGWQTYAWSYGAWEPRAHIQQYENSATLAGHSVDHDRSTAADFGQWIGIGGAPTMLTIQQASNFFEAVDSTHWRCKQNGYMLQDAILTFYQSIALPGYSYFGLDALGLPKSNETPVPGKQKAVVQRYECGIVAYDPEGELDRRPGGGGPVYLLKIDPLYGQLDTLNKQVSADNKIISTLQDQVKVLGTPDPLDAELRAAFTSLKPLLVKL
jgi:hypothetical protein